MKFHRICLIVLDSLGVGELSDAGEFGDSGAHTLLHTYQKLGGLKIPNLSDLGLLELLDDESIKSRHKLFASYFSRMKEKSQGKDTTTGHWEMMGLILEKGFDTFLNGFPSDFMNAWSQRTGCGYLGNKAASGTAIIDELGAEHVATKYPIVYTSADSVFQIAAHEKYFGLEKLHKLCEETRIILNESSFRVGRVIARPFLGEPGSFKRTENRRDFSVEPFDETVLEALDSRGVSVTGIGKIPDIFANRGITHRYESHNDRDAIEATVNALKKEKQAGLIFTNLNDLDMVYGHRRNVEGYGRQIETIDTELPKILAALSPNDLLILTADHGNDPTYRGTDHTREHVPLLIYSHNFTKGSRESRRLQDRNSFSDIGQTIIDNFGIAKKTPGTSFLALVA